MVWPIMRENAMAERVDKSMKAGGLQESQKALLAINRVSDNVRSRQALFERTNPCAPKSAPFRSR